MHHRARPYRSTTREFAKRNTKAVALSVDPVEHHHPWATDIGEVTGTPLNIPIVADPGRKIAELYDMVHPGSVDPSTVRSVCIVDPDNTLRLMLTAARVGCSIFATPQHRRDPSGIRQG